MAALCAVFAILPPLENTISTAIMRSIIHRTTHLYRHRLEIMLTSHLAENLMTTQMKIARATVVAKKRLPVRMIHKVEKDLFMPPKLSNSQQRVKQYYI